MTFVFLLKNLYHNLFYSDSLPCISVKQYHRLSLCGRTEVLPKARVPIGHICEHQRLFLFMLFKKAGLNIRDLNAGVDGFIFMNFDKLFDFFEAQFPHLRYDANNMYLKFLLCYNIVSYVKNAW